LSWHRFVKHAEYTNAHFYFAFWVLQPNGIPFKTEGVITTKDGHQFKYDTLAGHNVVIEHLGESHENENRREKDCWRKRILERDGFKVLEFWDSQIWSDPEGALAQVKEFLKDEKEGC